MENSVSLYGANGHCKVIIDILLTAGTKIDVIVDDNPSAMPILGMDVLHSSAVEVNTINNLILSIGNNKVRKRLAGTLKGSFSKAIHPTAIISKFCTLGEGTVVMAGAIINPGAVIGKHCIINTGAIIEHDCVIGDYAHISPGVSLAGNVTIGEGTHIGIGSAVIQGINIGQWATIGAGAVIIREIPDFAVAVGNPGKIIKFNREHE
jgi:sugar O-acyltransferase (sialic acid O-acetyltransferase NeuD family)